MEQAQDSPTQGRFARRRKARESPAQDHPRSLFAIGYWRWPLTRAPVVIWVHSARGLAPPEVGGGQV